MTVGETLYWFLIVSGICWALGMAATVIGDRMSDRAWDKFAQAREDVRRRTGGQL